MPATASSQYDAIVIGAGHNGLTAAALLAKARRRVLVVERRTVLGGAASTEEVFPGFWADTGGFDAGSFLPQVVNALNLPAYGLKFLENPALTFAPLPGGLGLTNWRDSRRTVEEIACFSERDALRYPEFTRLVGRLAGVLAEIMVLPPPSIPDIPLAELGPWLRPALSARRLGAQDMMALVRLLPMSLSDFLDEWFESDEVKAMVGAHAVIGSLQGPRSSGTAFMLLYAAVGAAPGTTRAARMVRGGAGALSAALASAARAHGAEICTGLGVAEILVDDGKVTGAQLENGETLSSRVVISGADPRHTLLDLVGAHGLEVRTVRDVRTIRMQASAARVNLLLGSLPNFTAVDGLRERLCGHIQICPDLDYLERAYDAAKYGNFSPRPYLDMVIPALFDPELRGSRPGWVMSLTVQYTPYLLKSGDWGAQRDALVETVLDTLEDYAPGIGGLVIDRQAITPLDLERVYGLTGGDIHHGQMGLDQLLFMRPVAGFSRFAMPVDGLYLCGAGVHPGGGLTGAPGYNAARAVLQAMKARASG